jgi:hypothetical protein
MDMTKFSSAEDPGYLSVSTEILRWVRAIQKAQRPAAAQSAYGSASPAAQASPMPYQGTQLPRGAGLPALGYGTESPGVFYSHGGNVISGNVNSLGGGKSVNGNTFHGPVTF